LRNQSNLRENKAEKTKVSESEDASREGKRKENEPEQWPISDVLLDQLVDILSVESPVLQSNDKEPILLLGVLLPLVLTVREMELLHREGVGLDFGGESSGLLVSLVDLGFSFGDLCDDSLPVCESEKKKRKTRRECQRSNERGREREKEREDEPAMSLYLSQNTAA